METSARLIIALSLIACTNHPDSALFEDVPAPSASAGSGATAGRENPNGGSGGGGNETNATAGVPGQPGGGSLGVGSAGEGGSPPGGDAGAAGAEQEPTPEPAVCGNGEIEAGEQCDDGGDEQEDGCDASCKVRCDDLGEDARMSADYHCYVGYDEAAFDDAKADCAARGGYLATIESADENELVRELVNTSKWIGAFEDVSLSSEDAGVHRWVTGAELSFENWSQAEPDRAASRCYQNGGSSSRCYEHCVIMQGDGRWADARCDLVDGYVCEWEPSGS